MKKFLLSFALLMTGMFSIQASADTSIVGAEDNSSTWWTAFSDYYALAPEDSLYLEFQNYSSEKENWNNWLTVVTTDADRQDTEHGYSEYFVLRCDNYGWGANYNVANLSSFYDWTVFKSAMDNSTVKLTVVRSGAKVTVHADITGSDGKEYWENYSVDCGDGTQTIRAFLTTELGHLVIDNSKTFQKSKSTVTGINSFSKVSERNDGNVYTLDGKAVSGKVEQKGLYIKNGRKFLVK